MSNILISTPPTSLATGLLQLDGGVAISSTPVYVADQTNTDSKLALSTASVNINTLTGSALVNIKGTGSTSATTTFLVQNSSASNSILTTDDGKSLLTANISNDAPLVVNNANGWTGSYVARFQTWLSAGSEVARMMANGSMILTANITASTFKATQNIPSDVSFGSNGSGNGMYMPASNVTAIATSATERLRVTSAGSLLIGTTTDSARLFVKGSGSTSATTSLLVQNSSSTNLLKVTDDNVTSIIGRASVGVASINSSIWSAYTEVLQVGQLVLGGYSTSPQAFLSNNSYFDGSNSRYFRTGGAGSINFTNNGSILFDMFASGTAGNVTSTSKQVYFDVSGNVGISTTSPTSRLHIVGSGSTSATTSLLVQNSSAVNKIFCNDDSTTLNLLSGVSGGSAAQVSIGTISTGTLYLESQVNGGGNGVRIYTDRQNTPIFFGCVSASTPTSESITIGNSTNTTGATHNIMFRQSNAVVGGFPNSANASYPSAQFFVESTTRGFLPPRMTTGQKLAILTPASGLMVYDTSLNQMSYFNGAVWVNI